MLIEENNVTKYKFLILVLNVNYLIVYSACVMLPFSMHKSSWKVAWSAWIFLTIGGSPSRNNNNNKTKRKIKREYENE